MKKRYSGLTVYEIAFVVAIELLALYFFIYKGYCGE
jgi:hypothetical protein